MKRSVLGSAFALATILASCSGVEEGDSRLTADNVTAKTSIEFEEMAYDFGDITQGEKVNHTFLFTNTGDADLVVVSAKGSCGCTVPDWPKEPIAPGASGKIEVVFNSEGKSGKQHKIVSVVANTEPATTKVAIKGNIIAPQEDLKSVAEPDSAE